MRAVLIAVVVIGAVAFVLGAVSADAPRAWSIYLVNLVFWSGLAVTGPAIAGMMQLTEARWSPAVRRIALTTAGFLPPALDAACASSTAEWQLSSLPTRSTRC